jgi:hypothetical protein
MNLPQDVGLWSSIIMDVFMTDYFKTGLITFETDIHETLISLYDIIWKEHGSFLIICLKENLLIVRRYVNDFCSDQELGFPTLCYPS